ncbi:MAG: PilZ domain-containing protein [Desulfosarcinaceae bacterium]|nr:PilZ domain-containing protein [Desulfosarcinaceae bacterium]
MKEEKRKHARYDALNLISYLVMDEEGAEIAQGMGRTLNVSQSGILLETHVALDLQGSISLSIGLAEQMVAIKGHVVFCHPGDDGKHETGIEFESLDEAARQSLDQYIQAFQSQ